MNNRYKFLEKVSRNICTRFNAMLTSQLELKGKVNLYQRASCEEFMRVHLTNKHS